MPIGPPVKWFASWLSSATALVIPAALFTHMTVTPVALIFAVFIWEAPLLALGYATRWAIDRFRPALDPDGFAARARLLTTFLAMVAAAVWILVAPLVADIVLTGLRLGGFLPYLAVLAVAAVFIAAPSAASWVVGSATVRRG